MSQATDPPFPRGNDQFKERDQGNSVVTVIEIFDITKLDGVDKFPQYCVILSRGNIYFAA